MTLRCWQGHSLARRELASLLLLPLLPADGGRQLEIRTRDEWRHLRERTLMGMQQVMGSLPSSPKTPPQVEVLEEERLAKCTRKKINYDSGDGDSVPAYLFIPHNQPSRNRAVLCLHQTTQVGKAEPAALSGKPNLHYALELAERGFVTLAPDYPNFGDYKYDPYSHGYVSATMKGVPKSPPCARPAYRHARSRPATHRRHRSLAGWTQRVVSGSVRSASSSCRDKLRLYLVPEVLRRQPDRMESCRLHAAHCVRDTRNHRRRCRSIFQPSWSHLLRGQCSSMLRYVMQTSTCRRGRLRSRRAGSLLECIHASSRLRVVHPDCEHDFPSDVRSMAYEFLATQM